MTQDEKLRILKLLEDGKISSTEAEKLIAALETSENEDSIADIEVKVGRKQFSQDNAGYGEDDTRLREEERCLKEEEARLREEERRLKEEEIRLREEERRLEEEEARLREESSKLREEDIALAVSETEKTGNDKKRRRSSRRKRKNK